MPEEELVWMCRDGRRYRPSEMSDRHLMNSISRIYRLNWRKSWAPILEAELLRRHEERTGEHAPEAGEDYDDGAEDASSGEASSER